MEKVEDYEGGAIYVVNKGKRDELFVWVKDNVAYGPYVSLEIARKTVKTYVSNPGGGGTTDYNQLANKPDLSKYELAPVLNVPRSASMNVDYGQIDAIEANRMAQLPNLYIYNQEDLYGKH